MSSSGAECTGACDHGARDDRDVMTDAPISGFVSLVIEPDPATVARTSALAAGLLPSDAELSRPSRRGTIRT
jgi:hypothetical protein